MRCSTCGAEAGDRAICPSCGTLLGVERGLTRITSSARAYAADAMRVLPRRLTINHFLWLCAVMPIFVAPPVASLAFAIFSMRQKGAAAAPINSEWLAIISLLNIVLSLTLLYKLHFSPYEVMTFIAESLKALLRSFLHVVPVAPQGPRVIPI